MKREKVSKWMTFKTTISFCIFVPSYFAIDWWTSFFMIKKTKLFPSLLKYPCLYLLQHYTLSQSEDPKYWHFQALVCSFWIISFSCRKVDLLSEQHDSNQCKIYHNGKRTTLCTLPAFQLSCLLYSTKSNYCSCPFGYRKCTSF